MDCLLEYIRVLFCTDVCGVENFQTYKHGGNQWHDVPVIRHAHHAKKYVSDGCLAAPIFTIMPLHDIDGKVLPSLGIIQMTVQNLGVLIVKSFRTKLFRVKR